MWDTEEETAGDTFVPVESSEPAAEPMEGVAEAAAAEPAPAAEPQLAMPEPEKRRKRVSIYWKRPKSHLYEYNFDYGANYYKGMVDYLDEKSGGYKPSPPKALSWAERALKTYSEKREAAARNKDKDQDAELLHKIRNSVNTYTVHARAYTRKITSQMTY